MADATSAQERTEQATPRKRAQARDEGQVARSVEVGSVVVLSTALVSLAFLGPRMADGLGTFLRSQFTGFATFEATRGSATILAQQTGLALGSILLPFLGVIAIAALAGQVAQTGIMITFKPLMPKANRISPATGAKRLFSKRSAVELVKSLVKIAVVGGIVTWSILETSDLLLPLMTASLAGGYATILGAIFRMAAAGAFALAILAILDFFFQRWDHEQQIKMTKQEVREEGKQTEGDPLLKSKIRARQQDMSRQRMMENVKTADVVVTNPIHYAVALKYDPSEMNAPRVVAKGARLLARRIRDIAREHGIPVVQDPPLARALYKACRIGSDVPLSLFKAVAEILAFVYRDRDGAPAGGRR